MRRRGELVERNFAHVLDRGGMRRAWLRGRENIHKRYLIHVAGFNLGVMMRALHGQGTPRQAAEAAYAFIFVLRTDAALAFVLIAVVNGEFAALVVIAATPTQAENRDFVTGLLGHDVSFRVRWAKDSPGPSGDVRIVGAFDELKDGHPRLAVRSETTSVDQRAFEGGEETLAHRIVVGVADRAC